MMITWEDFRNRRKIDLDMFKSYTYEDYSQWCIARYVEPVSQEAFEGVKEMVAKPAIVEEVVTVSTHEFNERQLRKLKKVALSKLCTEQSIDLAGNETKAGLISLLMALNKSQ